MVKRSMLLRAACAAPLILCSLAACGLRFTLEDSEADGTTGVGAGAESDSTGDDGPGGSGSSGSEDGASSTGEIEEPAGPPSFCEDEPECQGVECASDELAAELLAGLIATADESGFAEVFVPFEARVEDDHFHLSYTLSRPGARAMGSWTSAPAGMFDAAGHIESLWSPVWNDPDAVVAPEGEMMAALEECYPGLSENLGCFNMSLDFRLWGYTSYEDDAGCEVRVSAQVDPLTAFLAECTIEEPDCG